jgi:hypothetical protein
VVITYSTRFRRPLPLILDVTGHEDVRIGCDTAVAGAEEALLVGWYDAGAREWVASEALYGALFALLRAARDAGQTVYLTIA